MKKKTLAKIGSYAGVKALGFGMGYAWGKLMNAIFSKIITEERAEKHPWLCVIAFVVYIVALVAFPIWLVFRPLYYLQDAINERIDKAFPDEEEFE